MKLKVRTSTCSLGILILGMLFVTGCFDRRKIKWDLMNLVQEKPTIVDFSDGDGVREHGEVMVFEANLKDQNGLSVAQLLGHHTIVDLPGDDGIGELTVEERFTSLAFVFKNGSEIFVQGANVYPANQAIMQADAPQFRAITGGTESYKGIRGQVKSTRNSDETYLHVLEYTLD